MLRLTPNMTAHWTGFKALWEKSADFKVIEQSLAESFGVYGKTVDN